MAFLVPAQRGFQVMYDLYAGRVWFALAVLAGLSAAQWLVLGLLGVPSVYEGIGY